jgi:hypothetical protein
MRNKKSNLIYYLIAIIFIAAIAGVIVMEAPLKQEQVVQTIK